MRNRSGAGLLLLLVACGDAPSAPDQVSPTLAPLQLKQVSRDPAKHGNRLSKVLGCTGCHKDDLTGRDWSEPGYGTLWSVNLTRSARRWFEAELTAMIVQGRRPDRALMEMPSHVYARLHPDDVAALIAYLKSLEPAGPVYPEATIGPLLQKEIDAGEYRNSAQKVADNAGQTLPDAGPEHGLGRQIAGVTCAECHGIDLRGKPSPNGQGNPRPDLRMVASYSIDDFMRLMRTGKAAGNREVGLMSTVARRRYANLTDREVTAVHDYLTELAASDP